MCWIGEAKPPQEASGKRDGEWRVYRCTQTVGDDQWGATGQLSDKHLGSSTCRLATVRAFFAVSQSLATNN